MSNNALATLNDDLTSRYADDVFNELTIQGGFLPRVQLYTSSSKIVKKDLFKANHYGIVTGKDKIDDLGEAVNAVPLAVRPMALDLRGKKAVAYYDPTSEKFKELLGLSGTKDSKCMAGVQFLIYIQNVGLATYFCASKSAKVLAPQMRKLINQFVTLGSYNAESGDFVWRAPNISVSNVQFDLPIEEIKTKRAEFLNVTGAQVMDKDPGEEQDGESKNPVQPEGSDRPR